MPSEQDDSDSSASSSGSRLAELDATPRRKKVSLATVVPTFGDLPEPDAGDSQMPIDFDCLSEDEHCSNSSSEDLTAPAEQPKSSSSVSTAAPAMQELSQALALQVSQQMTTLMDRFAARIQRSQDVLKAELRFLRGQLSETLLHEVQALRSQMDDITPHPASTSTASSPRQSKGRPSASPHGWLPLLKGSKSEGDPGGPHQGDLAALKKTKTSRRPSNASSHSSVARRAAAAFAAEGDDVQFGRTNSGKSMKSHFTHRGTEAGRTKAKKLDDMNIDRIFDSVGLGSRSGSANSDILPVESAAPSTSFGAGFHAAAPPAPPPQLPLAPEPDSDMEDPDLESECGTPSSAAVVAARKALAEHCRQNQLQQQLHVEMQSAQREQGNNSEIDQSEFPGTAESLVTPALDLGNRQNRRGPGEDGQQQRREAGLVTRTWTSPRALLVNMQSAREAKLMPEISGITVSDSYSEVFFSARLVKRFLELPSTVLRICAVIPRHLEEDRQWPELRFIFLIVAALAIVTHSLVMAAMQPRHLYGHLLTACYAFGSAIGLICLRLQAISKLLGPDKQPLEKFAVRNGNWASWRRTCLFQLLLVTLAWLITAASRTLAYTAPMCAESSASGQSGRNADGVGSQEVLQVPYFIAATGFFTVLLYSQLHVFCGLELAVDNFTVTMVEHLDYAGGIAQWNVVQALLKRGAGAIDWCFLTLGTTVALTLLLTGVVVIQQGWRDTLGTLDPVCGVLWSGWVLPPVFMVLYAAFRAAAITELCCRVPSLLNSWGLEEGRPAIHYDRMYIVQHITLSAAGIYVSGVRLSASVVMKLAYFVGVVLFTLLTRAVLN